jgi:hypothetical protein
VTQERTNKCIDEFIEKLHWLKNPPISDFFYSLVMHKESNVRSRETALSVLMLVGSASWLVAQGLLSFTDAFGVFFVFAFSGVAFLAVAVLSPLVIVKGPPRARIALIVWFLFLVPSIFLMGHMAPPWVPISSTLVLTTIPLYLLVVRNNHVRSKTNA